MHGRSQAHRPPERQRNLGRTRSGQHREASVSGPSAQYPADFDYQQPHRGPARRGPRARPLPVPTGTPILLSSTFPAAPAKQG